ncbi:hypothetical protein NPX13_g10008 [Xylaria arbuscula]|uniref:Uncharacterized protein n=1 Tax=Xylaria arbuscula TaxID=114810 RepID=A0A9W8TH69_9PEZI|nr:hypothetical protein NPX13_g10008 [Xylaria arbuscula]
MKPLYTLGVANSVKNDNWSTVATSGSTGHISSGHDACAPPSDYGNNGPIKKPKKQSKKDKERRQQDDLRGIGSQFRSYGT